MSDLFRKFAERTSHAVGTPWAFLLAASAVVIWAATGPLFAYSDTWQLIINTSTTIVTFLMVFLIQNTQNRDARVVSLKLDELLRALHGARTGMVKLDHMSDEELEHIQGQFERLDEKFSTLVQDDIEHVQRELKGRRSKANAQQPDGN
jgi:low affinity Fe/Cu permease